MKQRCGRGNLLCLIWIITLGCGSVTPPSEGEPDAGASSGAAGGVVAMGGSGGQAGAGAAVAECSDDSECRMFSDCCTCQALAPNEADPPSCGLQCIQDHCSALGLRTEARCVSGRCVAGFRCDGQVTCRAAEPVCPSGSVASVVGNCWGPCVPTAECASVAGCAKCTGPQQSCVMNSAYPLPGYHCVTSPAACGSDATCGCLGPTVCVWPFLICDDLSGPRGVNCHCPTC